MVSPIFRRYPAGSWYEYLSVVKYQTAFFNAKVLKITPYRKNYIIQVLADRRKSSSLLATVQVATDTVSSEVVSSIIAVPLLYFLPIL